MDDKEKDIEETEEQEQELYYAVMYTPEDINGIMLAYKTIGVVKGYYDPEKRTFVSEASKREYEMLDSGILHLEDYSKMDVSNMPKKLGEIYQNGLFFAFPIKVSEFEAKFSENGAEVDSEKMMELGYGEEDPAVYQTCASYYNLFSVYNSQDQMNIFYMVDGDTKTLLIVNDLGQDIDSVIDEAEAQTSNRLPTISVDIPLLNEIVYGIRDFLYGTDEPEYVPPKKEETASQEAPAVEPYVYKKLDPNNFDPDELEAMICSEVIGQDDAIHEIVSTIYDDLTYCMDTPGTKSNILIVGPAGCGKTEIFESLRRHLNMPMATMDMSNLSKTGLVGNSIIQGIRNLVFECGGDVKAAQEQPTILLCDEIDKIRQATANDANQGVQDEFLSMLSGKQVTVPSESAYDRSYVFDTSKIIFICCGAFSELFEARKQDNKQMGFAPSAPKNVFRPVTTEDFKKSGIKPEVIRRLETIVTIRNLEEEDLYKLVTTSKISHLLIKEDAFLRHDNVVVYREPEYAHKVAEVAKKEDIGASGIKRVVEKSLRVATRSIRLLNGEGGTLVLRKETVTDPTDFDLYRLNGEKVYSKGQKLVSNDSVSTSTSDVEEADDTPRVYKVPIGSTYEDLETAKKPSEIKETNPSTSGTSTGDIENKYIIDIPSTDVRVIDCSKVKRIEMR